MKISGFFRSLFIFFFFFRPTIIFGSLQAVYLLMPFALVALVHSPSRFINTIRRTFSIGFLIAVGFVLIWSFALDLVSGELFLRSLRSVFLTGVRFSLYVLIAYAFVNFFCKTIGKLRLSLISAVIMQFFIMIAMIVVPSFKQFILLNLSGVDANSKFAMNLLDGVRGFGWSDELLYTAPAACFVVSMFFAKGVSVARLMLLSGSILFGALNARISLIFVVGYIRYFKFLLNYKIFFIIASVVIAIYYFREEILVDLAEYWAWWDYALGIDGLGPIRRLIEGHFEFPLSNLQFIFGNGEYLFGGETARNSDIGYLILLNFGGVFFLLAWLYICLCLIFAATGSRFDRLVLAIVFVVFGVKGLVFSGNAFTASLLVLAFARERWGARIEML